jgi:hypothetical protein
MGSSFPVLEAGDAAGKNGGRAENGEGLGSVFAAGNRAELSRL